MSINISIMNESLGDSVQELSKTYLSGKSTIDEYEIGTSLSNTLVVLKKILGCSDQDVLMLDEDHSTGRAEKLFHKLYKSHGKFVKRVKLDNDDKAELYNYNGVLLVVSSLKDYDKTIIYYDKKYEDMLNN